jgi:hypothetical protein
MTFNPALNLDAFATQSASAAPPSINALYLRDGKYDNDMTRASVADTFMASRAQAATDRLALLFQVPGTREFRIMCRIYVGERECLH